MRWKMPRPGPPRVVSATAVVAVVMGAAGWIAGSQIQSPADAAAGHQAPPASLVTVPIEQRSLTATVTARGTISYGTPRTLNLSGSVAGDADGENATQQLITKAPTAGRTLHEGDVLLEVSGRPVFVFTGSVPMYRTIIPGSTGDDVQQLRRAMRRLMPARQLASKGPFNSNVIDAVEAWYKKKGYIATAPSKEARAELRQLQQAVRAAEPGKRSAGRGKASTPGGESGETETDENTGDEQASADAESDLREFKKTYGTSVASGEILYLPKLPTRLNTVTVKAGAPATGAIGAVADPVLTINGDVGSEDADLLKRGLPATLLTTSGATFKATVSALGAAAAAPKAGKDNGGSGDGESSEENAEEEDAPPTGTPIRLKPKNAKKLAAFAGESVKITIRVGGTGGAVLTVPVAAVFTSADGNARVSVETGPGRSRDVPVKTGLSTAGHVEITPEADAELHAGDRVVVGKQ
jgi:hypothetical protein